MGTAQNFLKSKQALILSHVILFNHPKPLKKSLYTDTAKQKFQKKPLALPPSTATTHPPVPDQKLEYNVF